MRTTTPPDHLAPLIQCEQARPIRLRLARISMETADQFRAEANTSHRAGRRRDLRQKARSYARAGRAWLQAALT